MGSLSQFVLLDRSDRCLCGGGPVSHLSSFRPDTGFGICRGIERRKLPRLPGEIGRDSLDDIRPKGDESRSRDPGRPSRKERGGDDRRSRDIRPGGDERRGDIRIGDIRRLFIGDIRRSLDPPIMGDRRSRDLLCIGKGDRRRGGGEIFLSRNGEDLRSRNGENFRSRDCLLIGDRRSNGDRLGERRGDMFLRIRSRLMLRRRPPRPLPPPRPRLFGDRRLFINLLGDLERLIGDLERFRDRDLMRERDRRRERERWRIGERDLFRPPPRGGLRPRGDLRP